MSDHYERLGLPRRFSVDPATIEERYLARSREVHPDFHTLASAEVQQASLEQSAALNEAYLTLRDPYRRADYLLRLLGGPSPYEEKNLDQAFLLEMMDLRERMEESLDPDQAQQLETEIEQRLMSVMNDVAGHFTRIESREPGTSAPELVAIRRALNAARTLQSQLRDLRERLPDRIVT